MSVRTHTCFVIRSAARANERQDAPHAAPTAGRRRGYASDIAWCVCGVALADTITVDTNSAQTRTSTLVALSLASMLVAADVSPASAQNASNADAPATKGSWFARIGLLEAIYHSGATIATSGQRIPDATATVSNNLTLMIEPRLRCHEESGGSTDGRRSPDRP